ncbi:MAG: hypothetical protein K8Q97_04910 [Candidatus Andersenbacteria bacterium]|nr:hypothetical protein [Candidatus Andersenbacteria bacterium]
MAITKFFFIVLALIPAYAYAGQSETITISATVPPMRYVIVDHAFQIQEITSNSPLTIQPVVKMSSIDGVSVQWNSDIEKEYNKLLPNLDFSHPGVVYHRAQTQSVVALAISRIKQLVTSFI